MLSTHGGIRAPDGTPIALGYHTGHWEVGLLMEAAAAEFSRAGAIPFAASCTDPCDGRSQGTPAMFDSLPYRNDAATIFRRLIRSLPTRRGVLGDRHVRQGAAGDDDGARRNPRSAVRARAGRRDAAADRRRGCRPRADDRRSIRARRHHAGAGGRSRVPRVCVPRRWLSVSRHGGDVAGRRRSAWACRSATPRSRRPASRSGSTWRGGRLAR